MRGLYIITEGETEEEFVKNSISNYFTSKGIYDIRAIGMRGNVRYPRFKKNIEILLKEQHDILVTSLIDYYHLKSDFPNYSDSLKHATSTLRVQSLENSCAYDISNERFIPYIQLYEFEGLLFTKIDGFNEIPEVYNNEKIKQKLVEVIQNFPNPEEINEGDNTAPSKRLQNIISTYKKPAFGNIIASKNTFESILEKCPRFKNWIDTLIIRMKEK